MNFEDIAGYNYIDFKPKSAKEENAMERADICKRLNKAIDDELQAVMEYKGLVMHGFNVLSMDAKKEITEMANDETDHHAKFSAIKKELGCF